METHRRQKILQERDLQYAPRYCQDMFWQRYNHRVWRVATRVGDVTAEIMSDQALQSARRLRAVARAWQAIVPAGYEKLSRIEGLARQRLQVTVDSAATKYYLSRQVGEKVLASLNDHLGGQVVKRIIYRVGSLGAQA